MDRTRQAMRYMVLVPAIFLCACGSSKGASAVPIGEVYTTLNGDQSVKVRSGTEVEITLKGGFGGPTTLLGQYSIESDGRLRVVMEAIGTKQVNYFTVTGDGIKGDDGITLYSRRSIATAREKHYCGILEKDMLQLVTEHRQALDAGTLPPFLDGEANPRYTGVTFQHTSVPGSYFVLHAWHDQCAKALISDSRESDSPSWVEKNAAALRFKQSNESAQREISAATESAARRRDSIVAESQKVTKTLGTFQGNYGYEYAERTGRIVLTDVDIQGVEEESLKTPLRFGMIKEWYQSTDAVGRDRGGVDMICVVDNTQGNWSLTFRGIEERNRFFTLFESAITEWRQKYSKVLGE